MFPTTSSPNSDYYFINTLRDQFDVLLFNYTKLDVSDRKYPRMNRNDYNEPSLLIKSYNMACRSWIFSSGRYF
ncbi:hypothetical protein A3Q56_01283 [Intoshia linei]|uniref:Uncharacterized protein n=1 Tax=Intoshia linei TaxID=1819745 RepID=A0A177BBZ5_9BILA|nr:hypothetical protein A3Q56_01283 [Intoshia linei]